MFTWKPSGVRMDSACTTCNLLTEHRRLSVVRCTAVLWVLRNRSITNRIVDSHAIAILSLSEDIETILIRLNAKHSTFRVPTQRPSILTDLSIGTKSHVSHCPTCGTLVDTGGVWFWKWPMAKASRFSVMERWSGPRARSMVRERDSLTREQRSRRLTGPFRLLIFQKNFVSPIYRFFALGYFPRLFWHNSRKVLREKNRPYGNSRKKCQILTGTLWHLSYGKFTKIDL